MQDRVEELLAQAQLLSLEDQIRLLKELIKNQAEHGGDLQSPTLEDVMELEKAFLADIEAEKLKKTRRSILEFEGMDQESWKDVDVAEYIRQGRGSCNENTPPLLDVREFRGIGHGTWIDAGGIDEFIRQERASWDV